MNGKAIGVAAGLLLGGGALYGGYQAVEGRDADPDVVAEAVTGADGALPRLPGVGEDVTARRADASDRLGAARGGRGIPAGTTPLDFDGGATGDDLTSAARAQADEAQREAERLAALGTDELDLTRAPGDDEARDEPARGLRGAPDTAAADAGDDDSDVERLLADIAAQADAREAVGAVAVDASADQDGRFTANRRLTDKPDQGGFAANRRLTDKPDQGGYVASADTRRFDPCQKADGTTYVGPGTALDPFAEADPCLPQATAQGYQVAQAATVQAPPVLVTEPVPSLVAIDVPRPRLPPPPPTGTGSDYRG